MSINYKIKLYYCIIGGPYHCHHHCCSHHCCQPLSFSSSCRHCNYAPTLLIMVLFSSLSHPRHCRCCSHLEGLWQVVIGVWYKNLKDGEVQSVVHMLFGQVYLPATRWLDGWTDNGVSNCQIFWVLTGLVCVWTGLRCETAGPLAFDLARAAPTSIDVVCIVTRWNYEGAAVNLNSCVDLPGAADTSPSCSNTRVAMHVTYHPSSFVWQWVV